jgi:large subunit ribosomal protein L9
MMKVILLEDVDTLGKLGDTVNVKDGYARNYLIPRNLALQATTRNIKAHAHKLRDIERRKDKIVDDARSLADKVAGVSLTFTRKTGDKGRLFGSVTNMDIAQALEEKGLAVDRKDIHLPEPIKSLGEFDVQIKLHHDVTPEVKITVLPEEGEIPEEAFQEEPAKEETREPEAEAAAEETPEDEAAAAEEAVEEKGMVEEAPVEEEAEAAEEEEKEG